MSAKHTPGPWKAVCRSIDNQENDYFLGWDIEGPPEAQRGQFERGADARLIAAAPQMLSALEYAYKRLVADNAYVGDPLIGVVFSAITAAKGGES